MIFRLLCTLFYLCLLICSDILLCSSSCYFFLYLCYFLFFFSFVVMFCFFVFFVFVFFLMIRRPPRSTRTDTLFPYTTLFRSGTGTQLRAPRTLFAALRGRQYPGCELHHAGQLFPHPAPADAPVFPQAPYHDDAQVAAATQDGRVEDRRFNG